MDAIEKKVEDISKWALEKKAEDVVVADISKKSSFTDFFVICTANGKLHTKAVAENILENAKLSKYQLLGKEGLENGEWILLDYGDVIVHIFDAPIRDQYKLEELWQKLPPRETQEG